MLKKVIEDFMDLKSLVKLVVGVAIVSSVTAYVSRDYVEEIKSDLVKEISESINKPAYVIVEYDLLKQLEKLVKDPDDIKFTDVRKFVEFCDKDPYFRNVYLPKSKESRALEIACDKISEKFDEAYTP